MAHLMGGSACNYDTATDEPRPRPMGVRPGLAPILNDGIATGLSRRGA